MSRDRSAGPAGLARRAIIAFDRWLCRRQEIFPYSDDPDCILRAAIRPAPADLELSDGGRVRRGDPVIDLHLWNERVPSMDAHGPDFAWFAAFDRQFKRSLAELAAYLARHPELQSVHAVRIETAFGRAGGEMTRLGRRYGFDLVHRPENRRLGRRIHWFFAGFLFLALTWAYNPASLRGKRFVRHQDEFWMTRATLERRYGAGHGAAGERRRGAGAG
ncbi:MAG: hypothetical protein IRY94_14840 [Rhodospirillaceae bacterium]|nr:hypothetical protein [Rhodospirillaceae bacterium]